MKSMMPQGRCFWRYFCTSLALVVGGWSRVFPAEQQAADQQAFVIRGRVVDGSNHPVQGATVNLHSQGRGAIELLTTDETGSFEFPAVQKGTYFLHISAKPYAEVKRKIKLADSPPKPLEIVLHYPGRIKGVVRYGSDQGEPIPHAGILVGGSVAHELLVTAAADEQGRFEVEVAPGSYAITPLAAEPLWIPPVAVKENTTTEVVVTLPEGKIVGQVVDDAGEPVQGVLVLCLRRSFFPLLLISRRVAERLPDRGMAITDEEGRFTIRYARPGLLYDVVAVAEGFLPTLAPDVRAIKEDEAAPGVILSMSRTTGEGTLRLRIRDQKGQGVPLPGIHWGDCASDDTRLYAWFCPEAEGAGSWELRRVPAGVPITLTVSASQLAPCTVAVVPLENNEVREIEVTLTAGGSIVGTVKRKKTDEDGNVVVEPVEKWQAFVAAAGNDEHLRAMENQPPMSATGSGRVVVQPVVMLGSYQLRGLTPGKWKVGVLNPSGMLISPIKEVAVEEGKETSLDFILEDEIE